MSIANEIIMIFILILVNALLAMSEAALVASRKARLQQQAGEGNKSSALALKLIEDPNIFLSTVQIGITLIGVLAGAVGGATIAESLGKALQNVPYIGVYSTSIALGIVVISITTLTIWLGELVPKRLGLNSPEKIAQVVAGPMLFLSRIFSPFIKLMSLATNFVLRLFGVNASSEPPITEEELQMLISQGTQAGVFQEAEQDMVEALAKDEAQHEAAHLEAARLAIVDAMLIFAHNELRGDRAWKALERAYLAAAGETLEMCHG